jgi:uncharacterized DUF497 family protein
VLAERHIDLLDMRSLFDGRPVVSYAAPRHDEERWKTVGFVNRVGFVVVWTLRDDTIRLITARRARDGEERDHRQRHG